MHTSVPRILVCALALTFMLASSALAAEKPVAKNPVELLTGTVWVQTPAAEKEAFLFGVECAIAVEHIVAEKMAEAVKAKKRSTAYTLSPFEKGWATAFNNVNRKDISKQVDAWYVANPDKLERPVFEVLWYELIAPKLASR